MPPRKRKVTYPVARTSKRQPPADAGPNPNYVRTSLAIDTTAGAGRTGLTVGARVRIVGTGLYTGEAAVIVRFAGNVIPSALVKTEAGHTRQVRTIDLEPIPPEA
jgi:hypothetical protein